VVAVGCHHLDAERAGMTAAMAGLRSMANSKEFGTGVLQRVAAISAERRSTTALMLDVAARPELCGR
jgi:hypothetical protein